MLPPRKHGLRTPQLQPCITCFARQNSLEKCIMTAQPKASISEEEYLVYERASSIKHEYYHGHIYAMTGGKEPHNLIAGNTLASLHSQLRRKPCRVYPSDMRVKVLRTGLNTYPDVVVICGQPQFTMLFVTLLRIPPLLLKYSHHQLSDMIAE